MLFSFQTLRALRGVPRLSALSSIATGSAGLGSSSSGSAFAGPSRGLSTSPVVQVLKTHSGAKKRFRLTGGGLFKRGQAGKQHLNTSFSASRINRLGKTVYANKAQSRVLRRLLPHA